MQHSGESLPSAHSRSPGSKLIGAPSYDSASRPTPPVKIRYRYAPARVWRRPVLLLQRNSLFARCSQSELEQLAATAYPNESRADPPYEPAGSASGHGFEGAVLWI